MDSQKTKLSTQSSSQHSSQRKICVYCGGRPITREHAIGRAVLRIAFGPGIRNIARSELYSGPLLDHQQTVRDLCRECNNVRLARYDEDGVVLAKHLSGLFDLTGQRIPFTRGIFGWLVKTHLNHFRVIPNKFTGERYKLDDVIVYALIHHKELPTDRFAFLLEGWQGVDYFWDENSDKRIPWVSYRSVQFLQENIVVSNFRMKCLDTFLMLPSNESLDLFVDRVDSVRRQMAIRNMHPTLIDVRACTRQGFVEINRVVPLETLLTTIRRYDE